jgi:hypothetical protein
MSVTSSNRVAQEGGNAPPVAVREDTEPESVVRASRSSVRLVGARRDGSSIVELTTSVARNSLHRVYRALCSLGVQLVQTEVRALSDDLVQKLYLLEPDGRGLSPSRLSEVLMALMDACERTEDVPWNQRICFG